MDEQVPIEVKRAILENSRAVWRNTAYEATVAFRIAKRIDDAGLMASAQASIARAEKMIAGYDAELEALLNGQVTE